MDDFRSSHNFFLNTIVHVASALHSHSYFVLFKKDNPEINPDTHGQLIFDEEGKMQNGKKTIFLASDDGKNGQLHVKQ